MHTVAWLVRAEKCAPVRASCCSLHYELAVQQYQSSLPCAFSVRPTDRQFSKWTSRRLWHPFRRLAAAITIPDTGRRIKKETSPIAARRGRPAGRGTDCESTSLASCTATFFPTDRPTDRMWPREFHCTPKGHSFSGGRRRGGSVATTCACSIRILTLLFSWTSSPVDTLAVGSESR